MSMTRIPQLENTEPEISPVSVKSNADSYEAFAQTLGSLSKETSTIAEDIGNAESKSMYVNSVANAQQLKTQADIRMLQNPNQASTIANQTSTALKTLESTATVNNKDRGTLNYYVTRANDAVALKAAETNVKQTQLSAGFTHFENFPDQLKAYQDALVSDPVQAQKLHDAMISNLRNLVSVGALTPEQAGSSIKSMGAVVDIAHDNHLVYGNPNATAQDYHTVNAHLLNDNKNNPNQPINGNTQWLIDNYNTDKTFQGVLADISNRKLPNMQAFDSLPANQRQRAMMAIQGTQMADGMINSGASFPEIENAYQTLEGKNRILNYQDQATRNALGNYIKDLKSGNYLNVVQQTPAGNKIMQDFNDRNSAIQSTMAYSPSGRQQALADNQNNLVNQLVSYGQAHHIPNEYIQPIPKATISSIQNAFQLGQDPSSALTTLNSFTKQNQNYVAAAMKDPDQRLVMQSIAWAPNTVSDQEKIDFIAANQKGRSYINTASNKALGGDVKDSDLENRIYSNLSPAMQMLAQTYGNENAQVLQNSMRATTLKYAKYLAQKDNNMLMEDKPGNLFLSPAQWKQYTDEASKIYSGSFQQVSGANYIVNPQQLSMPLTSHELDALAQYATNKGYDYLHQGRQDAEFISATARSPLKMIITPTNDVQATDGNGKIYFSTPLRLGLIALAQKENAARHDARFTPNANTKQ